MTTKGRRVIIIVLIFLRKEYLFLRRRTMILFDFMYLTIRQYIVPAGQWSAGLDSRPAVHRPRRKIVVVVAELPRPRGFFPRCETVSLRLATRQQELGTCSRNCTQAPYRALLSSIRVLDRAASDLLLFHQNLSSFSNHELSNRGFPFPREEREALNGRARMSIFELHGRGSSSSSSSSFVFFFFKNTTDLQSRALPAIERMTTERKQGASSNHCRA